MSKPEKLYSVQYIKITKAISDFENSISEVVDGLYHLPSSECKELFDDLEGTVQSIEFLTNALSSLNNNDK